jgi:hypothetical protein
MALLSFRCSHFTSALCDRSLSLSLTLSLCLYLRFLLLYVCVYCCILFSYLLPTFTSWEFYFVLFFLSYFFLEKTSILNISNLFHAISHQITIVMWYLFKFTVLITISILVEIRKVVGLNNIRFISQSTSHVDNVER